MDYIIQEGMLFKIPTMFKNRLDGKRNKILMCERNKILILRTVISFLQYTKFKVSLQEGKDKSQMAQALMLLICC